MLKRHFRIISLLTAIFWLVSVNHCVLEALISDSHQDEQRSACSSHGDEDPSSHSEGQPCISKIINTKTQQAKSPIYSKLSLFVHLFIVDSRDNDDTKFSLKRNDFDFKKSKYESLIFYSILSNAPPQVVSL